MKSNNKKKKDDPKKNSLTLISFYVSGCKTDAIFSWNQNKLNVSSPPEVIFEFKVLSEGKFDIHIKETGGNHVFRKTIKLLSVNCHLLPPKIGIFTFFHFLFFIFIFYFYLYFIFIFI